MHLLALSLPHTASPTRFVITSHCLSQSVPDWVAQEDAATSHVYRQSSRHMHDGVSGRYALQQHWERQQEAAGTREGAFESPRSQRGGGSWHGGSQGWSPHDEPLSGGMWQTGSMRSVMWRANTAGTLVEEEGCSTNGVPTDALHGVGAATNSVAS